MVMLYTKNGLPWPNLYPCLVISMDGTEKSSEVAKTVLDALISQFLMLVVNQESNICPNIKLTLRDLMVRRKTEIQFGQDMLFKIKNHLSLIVYSGTLQNNSNGLILHQHQSQIRVIGFMRLMWVCLKSSVELVHTETLPISISIESRIQDIM